MKFLSQLVTIGERAVEHQKLQRAKAESKSDLNEAYSKWKEDHGIERVEAGTEDWAEMMEVTTPEFKAYRKAAAAEYNAKQRLKRATMAHLLAN